MRKMKDSGIEWIGEIPVGWDILPVKRFFRHTKRVVGSAVDEYERLALTMNGVIKRSKDDSEGLQPEKFEGYQILKENELVFKLIDLENVKTSRVGLSPYTGLVSPAYIVITNNKKDNRFYYYWFMFMYYNEIFNHLGGEGVRSALNAKDVLSLPVPAISDEMMTNISTYLDTKYEKIDSIIARQQEVIEKLKAYKLSVITEAVTKGLNPDVQMKDSGVEWIGDVPEHWEICKFKFLGKFVNGYAFPSSAFKSVGVRVMKIANIQPMSISWEDESFVDDEYLKLTNYLVCKGDLVFALTRPIINGGIKVAIADNTEKVLLNQRNAMFKGQKQITTKWQYYLMQNNMFVQEFALYIDGTGQQPNISTNEIANIPIPVPAISEQQQIADYLDKKCSAIDSTITKKQAIIEKITEYKKSLIYEVVTGKREV